MLALANSSNSERSKSGHNEDRSIVQIRNFHERIQIVSLSGSLDKEGAHIFQNPFHNTVSSTKSNVLVDMSEIETVASAGLKLLASAAALLASKGRRIALVGCEPDVMDLISLVFPQSVLMAFDDLEAAVSYLEHGAEQPLLRVA